MTIFKYLLSEHGFRRLVEVDPKGETRRERFALWVLRKFAPRLTAMEVGVQLAPMTSKEAREEWITRMSTWMPPRNEDIHRLEFVEDEVGDTK